MSSIIRVAAAAAALTLTISPSASAASGPGDNGFGLARVAPASMAAFGAAVAAGDGEVFVGEAQTLFRPGAVYIFRKGAGGWAQATTVQAPDSKVGDGFGSRLLFDGTTLFVSAGPKMLHTYRKAGTTWQHSGTIEAATAGADVSFGPVLSVSGDWLMINKQPGGFQQGSPPPTGTVYAFRRGANGQFAYHSTIVRTDSAAAGNGFGTAIGLNGNVALIGANGERARAGLVHEYVFENNAWTFKRSIAPFSGGMNHTFGSRIAVYQNFAAITAAGEGGGYGAVYLFRKSPTGGPGGAPAAAGQARDSSWAEVARLTSPTGRRQENFGVAIALDAREIWVGAPTSVRTGATYVFKRDSLGLPSAATVLPAGDLAVGSASGASISIRGNLAAVGATGAGGGGGVVIYERDAAGNWQRSPMMRVALDELTAMTGSETQCANGKVGPFECSNSSLMSFLPPSRMTHDGHYIEMNDTWGWTDPQTGKEWALVGRRDGMTFVDMSDATNPVPVADMPMSPGSTPQAWRDMKVYKNHTYVVADNSGQHGMQVFDLTRLRTLRPVNGLPVKVEPDLTYRGIASAHNVVINEESGFAYAVGVSGGGESCGGGLHMIDIREPKKPTFAGCFSATGTGRTGTGYSHDAQCVTYKGPDARYKGHEICIGSNETAISIADVTDKKAPKALSHASYPNVAYAHQGWFTDDHKYFYLDDEIDELQYAQAIPRTRTLVWDLTDLENPRLAKEHIGEATSSDHNLYVLGNQVYQANYMSGLRILDIEDRENPKEVSFFDTDPYRQTQPGYSGAWSVYPYFKSGAIVVNSIEQGLFIVKQSPRTVF